MLRKIKSSFVLLVLIDISDIFTGIQKVSLLYFVPYKSDFPNFATCLVVFGIVFSFIVIFFRDIDKAQSGHFEN